jgi:Response regulator receiver domain
VAIPELISIVDDDESVRQGLGRLLTSVGFAVKTFASADEYLNADQLEKANCLLLDIRMPGMSRQKFAAANARISLRYCRKQAGKSKEPMGRPSYWGVKPTTLISRIKRLSLVRPV